MEEDEVERRREREERDKGVSNKGVRGIEG